MKTYFVKDKSGRCGTNTLTDEAIKIVDDAEDLSWDGERLNEWTPDADCGDVWENNHIEITCIAV
jgi:hypothetical protein